MLRAVLLAPILIPQALWVAARATRLPEAAGEREGRLGAGPSMRVLVLGDSSAAGVGVQHQAEALAGQLVTDLARDHCVEWQLIARSGATVASTLPMLSAARACDVALICLGVNDVKNGVSRAKWRQGYAALLADVRQLGAARIVVSGLPPVARFPLLPSPLRNVLGARAEAFDADLQAVAASGGAIHLPFDGGGDENQMATDGFHPGPIIYAEWAARAATALRAP